MRGLYETGCSTSNLDNCWAFLSWILFGSHSTCAAGLGQIEFDLFHDWLTRNLKFPFSIFQFYLSSAISQGSLISRLSDKSFPFSAWLPLSRHHFRVQPRNRQSGRAARFVVSLHLALRSLISSITWWAAFVPGTPFSEPKFKRFNFGCIESDICDQILVQKRLTSSTMSTLFSASIILSIICKHFNPSMNILSNNN